MKSYFLVVLVLFSGQCFLEAQESTYNIRIKKTEIELLEPLTIELNFKYVNEPKPITVPFVVYIEEVVNEGAEGVKFDFELRLSPVRYWSEQGKIRERILILHGESGKFAFEKAGTYKVQIKLGGITSTVNQVQIQVHNGSLNWPEVEPLLKEKLLSVEFFNLMYSPEEENGTGVQYAHELMAQYPQSALARYAKNAVALNSYRDFFNDEGTIEEGKSALLQHAGELKSVLKDNPVKGHYLTRLTKYNRGEALYYGDKLEKSRDLLNKLLKRPDDVRLKAVDQLKYVLHAIKTENPGSSPLDAKTLHEMMVIDSQQYLDSEVEEEEEGDED
jgi:hypothetical protein